ncbi:MAG: hypothetical protein ACFFEN_10015 [Candidatus Thorarchaeota archaeon]
MMDSEIHELRKRKFKRIILWTAGAAAIIALISIITVFVVIDMRSSGG